MSSVQTTILIVEDDENLGLALRDNLEDEGFTVELCTTAQTGLLAYQRSPHHALAILDLMLPDMDGYTLCRKLRAQGPALMIMMLTARTLEDDLERGFEAGADDYLTKPYRLRELLLRVKALLRRGGTPESAALDAGLNFGCYTLDVSARKLATPGGRPVELTRTEFDLLVYLLRHRDRALTRAELLDEVWGKEVVVDERTVDNFVSSIKRKLDWKEHGGFQIRTIRGVGYRMEVEGEIGSRSDEIPSTYPPT